MAEPTNEPTKDTSASDDAALDQSMIDSLMDGGSGGGVKDAQTPTGSEPHAADVAGSSGVQEISQTDIDALMGRSAGEDAPHKPDMSTGSEEINQGDIDALMGASGSEDVGSQPGDASVPSTTQAKPNERLDTLGRPFDAVAAETQVAIDAEKADAASAAPPSAPAAAPPVSAPVGDPLALQEFEIPAGLDIDPKRVTMLGDVNLPVNIELGRTEMKVEDVLQLDEGSVVELDKLAGDPVDVYINGRLVARGEVLVLNDNFCVRIGEVISNDPHRVSA